MCVYEFQVVIWSMSLAAGHARAQARKGKEQQEDKQERGQLRMRSAG